MHTLSEDLRYVARRTFSAPALLLGLGLMGVCYGAASWAIDNGRLSLYAVTFISLIMGTKFLVQGIKQLIRN